MPGSGSVTERDRGAERGTCEEARFTQLLEALPNALFTLSGDRACDFVNRAFVEYTGQPRDRLLGHGWIETVHAEDRARLARTWESRGKEPVRTSCRVRGKDGEHRWFDVQFSLSMTSDGRTRWVGGMTPMPVAPSEEVLTRVLDSVDDVVWVRSPSTGRIAYINEAYERVWGRSRAKLEDDPNDWLAVVHPSDRARVGAVAAGPVNGEYRIVRADGKTRWLRVRERLVRDAHDEPMWLTGAAEDVTERRELETQLRATQRTEALGQLAGGVAHDFNNLLTIIIACTDEVIEGVGDSTFLREPLQELRLAVQRAGSLTRDLLAFSRRQAKEPEVVDVNDVVREAERMLRRLLGEDIALDSRLAAHPLNVEIDSGQWTSVLVNLAVNARHAMPRGGTLSIAIRELALSEPLRLRGATLPAGTWAVLEMTDTGEGFGPEIADRIFEPFFTTKSGANGTGLGLAVVRGIVKESGGVIEATSEPGAGATFSIYIPVVDAPRAAGPRLAAPPKRGTETVLLVEDEVALRRAARRGLEAHGFKVLLAGTGEEALRILEEEGDKVDLLVTDVVLPKMDGLHLVRLAQERAPRLRVLFTSGYATDDMNRYGAIPSSAALVEKPYTPLGLVRKMRQVLDAR